MCPAPTVATSPEAVPEAPPTAAPDPAEPRTVDEAAGIAEAPQATLEATKRYLVGSAGATFEQAFAVEHDGVFETFLAGAVGPRQGS